MLKYVETLVTFSEFPDEISLCINISNCPNACVNCHSSYLKEDIGTILDYKELDKLIQKNHGITCIGFMGDGIGNFIQRVSQCNFSCHLGDGITGRLGCQCG